MDRPLIQDTKPFQTPTITNVCAIVITFNPSKALIGLIETLTPQFSKIFVVDNTPNGSPLIKKNQNVEIRYNTCNLGIARALNQGINDAFERGYEWAVTFDQDSEPCAVLLSEMINACTKLDGKEFLLGANYYHAHRNRIAHSGLIRKTTAPVARTTLITSGMLLRIRFAREIGGFRDEYFIDSVDHEFCLRASQHGAKVFITSMPLMRHHIGMRSNKGRFPSALSLSHAPSRKYYIARNTIWTVRSYISTNPIWCIRQIARIFAEFTGIAFESNRRDKAAAFIRGTKDGLNTRGAT